MTTTTFVRRSLLAASITAALSAGTAFATNGLAPTGLGMEHRAMGGAAAGYAANTMSMATNPASASFVGDGYDVGIELFMPEREVQQDPAFGGAKFSGNGKTTFFIPEAGYKRSLNDKVSLGIAAYGNGGMNTEYSTNPGFGAGTAGLDYQQLFVSPTVGYKLNDNHSIGVAANLVYHKFKADGLQGIAALGASSDPANLTNKGYDSSTGIGASIGWQGNLTDRLSAGVAYRSKVKMGKLDKYKGLFANQGEFDVPAATTVGVAFKATPKTTFAFDAQRVHYSDVPAIANSSTKLATSQMGATDGPGFGWDDVTAYKLGVKHQLTNKVALMGGVNYGKQPVKSSETTVGVLAPAVTEKHLSLGAEIKTSPKSKVTVAYVRSMNKRVEGTALPTTSPLPLDMFDLEMEQNAIGVAYSREF